MKVLLYSDNHFCKSSSIINSYGDKYSARLENQVKSINWVEELAVINNCDLEICLGDFFDKNVLDAQELTALKEIQWNNVPKYFIVGNHEMGNNDLSYNSSNVLSQIGKVIDKPTLIDISNSNYCLILLPYILETNRDKLHKYIEQAYKDMGEDGQYLWNKNLGNILLTHNDIKGIQYGGFISTSGFEISEIEQESVLCINGHLHNAGKITDKIHLIGNLTGLNFSEDASKYKHYAFILDTETLKFEMVENPYAFNFYKFEINENNIDTLNNVKSNSAVSIKVSQRLSEEIKEIVYNNPNIIKSRVTLILDTNNIDKNNKQEIISKDHIQQYKEYILEHLGCDDIIKDELSRL